MTVEIEDEGEYDDSELSLEDAIDAFDGALRHASDACQTLSDEFEVNGFDDRLTKGLSEHDKDKRRRLFAGFAAQLAEDRYSAGSTAAKAVMQILLNCTTQDVINFIADIEHHEVH